MLGNCSILLSLAYGTVRWREKRSDCLSAYIEFWKEKPKFSSIFINIKKKEYN
jgi:hypothetical protein